MSQIEMKRRLAAILAADVAGYSRLMSLDEFATVAALDSARTTFRTETEANGGQIVDMAGDSVLAFFGTAAGAVKAALAVQGHFTSGPQHDRAMRFRIGIHLGDVLQKSDGSIYGDGVNIAARLEGLSEPGGIAVSESIRVAVAGKMDVRFHDLGKQSVKNMPEPVHVYRMHSAGDDAPVTAAAPLADIGVDLSLPDRPSVAVLAFNNMSGDPEQEYFTDGITEDIITELSRFDSLFVIARNSSFTYKGEPVDVKKVSRELGVRYVVEGSIRRSAERIRVTAQLIDSFSGKHVWAEKYDRVVTDVFAVQDEVVECIVGAIAPQVNVAEAVRARRRPRDVSAYEIAQRALATAWDGFQRSDAKARVEALALGRAALRLDLESLEALKAVAFVQWQNIAYRTSVDPYADWQEAMGMAERAISLSSSAAHALKAALLAYSPPQGRWEEARLEADLAWRSNPNDSVVLSNSGFILAYSGAPEEGIRLMERALRINPRDPFMFNTFENLAQAHLAAGRYAEGLTWAKRATTAAPTFLPAYMVTAALYVGMGRVDKARETMGVVRGIVPEAARIKPRSQKADAAQAAGAGSEARQRYQTFLRIAAGVEELEPRTGATNGAQRGES
ncbi:MAG: adenylate/guanylate cyclase domain-containing protein [Caldimonas sp.]